MGDVNLQNVVNILQIVSTLEPAVVAAILALVQKMEGKSTADILAEADSTWADVAAQAKKELGIA